MAVATADDDAEVRALLRRSVIPGAVRVAFTREPDYFLGEGLAGSSDVTIVARRGGVLVAVGRCSVLTLFVNGRPQRVGYLGELRMAPGTPASPRLLRDGYAFLAELTDGWGVERYVTSIADDNDRARRVLAHGGRFGLPAYRPIARLVTLVAPVTRRASVGASSPTNAPAIDHAPESELTEFLQSQAKGVQLGLCWDRGQWEALSQHGLSSDAFSAVRRHGRVVATGAVWDQRAFRQTVIDGYSSAMRVARPFINAIMTLRSLPPLPAPGERLAMGAVCGATVTDPNDWTVLWQELNQSASASGLLWLAVVRDVRDPDLALLRRTLAAREYRTTLFDVALSGRPHGDADWDGRLFRPEVGLL